MNRGTDLKDDHGINFNSNKAGKRILDYIDKSTKGLTKDTMSVDHQTGYREYEWLSSVEGDKAGREITMSKDEDIVTSGEEKMKNPDQPFTHPLDTIKPVKTEVVPDPMSRKHKMT